MPLTSPLALPSSPARPARGPTSGLADSLRAVAASRLARALVVSQCLALAWWRVAVWLRTLDLIPVWYDQQVTFTQLGLHLLSPYAVPRFANPPWAALLLAPFSLVPLPLAVLLQLGLYFGLLTCLVFKYGGGLGAVLITLTSFLALDNALELNIEWLVAIGLLVPPALSGPFLLIKPQLALGAWLPVSLRTFAGLALVVLITGMASLVVWTDWPLRMAAAVQEFSAGRSYNLAPLALMPPLLSLAAGLVLAWHARRRRDPAWGLLAWLFLTPYITLYSLLLHFAVLSARNWRLALLLSGVVWLIYGGVLALFWLKPA